MTPPGGEIPTNIDFATDVKSDRLKLLNQVTLAASLGLVLLTFTLIASDVLSLLIWLAAPLVLAAACVVSQLVLRRGHYEVAASIYTLGWLAAVAVALAEGGPTTTRAVPFVFVLVIFVAGLLLRPSLTLLVALFTSVLTILVPTLVHDGDIQVIDGYQIVAIVLVWLSALLAVQVTGELYAVTEWALSNYQRERKSKDRLFDSRNELQRTLKRTEVLSEQLQDSNEALEKARAAAEAAKNFRGQFLANMSHELRTPLNAIIGFSETMLKFPVMYDNEALPAAYRADMNQIYTSGQQLLTLINDILDLARVDAGKLEIFMERVTLQPVIDAVMATANGLIGSKPITLECELPPTLPEVWADETRVRQVLLNLYSNAAKFTDSGTIRLRIRETDEGIQFSVSDTGKGIAPDQLEVVFEEFQQAESASGRDPRAGAGLGLTISRQLLDLMNGRIWAESTLGEGSVFHFILQPYHKSKSDTAEVSAVRQERATIPLDAQPVRAASVEAPPQMAEPAPATQGSPDQPQGGTASQQTAAATHEAVHQPVTPVTQGEPTPSPVESTRQIAETPVIVEAPILSGGKTDGLVPEVRVDAPQAPGSESETVKEPDGQAIPERTNRAIESENP